MANIKDVAEWADVTVTTVSRTMNDRGYPVEPIVRKST
jgi:DNA-binding LacI/PurR family transcriptional regulator